MRIVAHGNLPKSNRATSNRIVHIEYIPSLRPIDKYLLPIESHSKSYVKCTPFKCKYAHDVCISLNDFGFKCSHAANKSNSIDANNPHQIQRTAGGRKKSADLCSAAQKAVQIWANCSFAKFGESLILKAKQQITMHISCVCVLCPSTAKKKKFNKIAGSQNQCRHFCAIARLFRTWLKSFVAAICSRAFLFGCFLTLSDAEIVQFRTNHVPVLSLLLAFSGFASISWVSFSLSSSRSLSFCLPLGSKILG